MADIFPPTDDIAPTGNSYGYYDEHYAAEIERLRAALREIAYSRPAGPLRNKLAEQYEKVARAALANTEPQG